MRRIDAKERRARLGRRHHLAERAGSVEQISGDLHGLHSSDPATVFLSARARVHEFERRDLEAALYDHRTLVRMLGMRRTLFVLPVQLAARVNAACARIYQASERKRLIGMLEDQGIATAADRWLERVLEDTMQALTAHGQATAAELTKDVPDLGLKITFGEGTRWAGSVGVSTRVLFLLATEGRIVRARPRGSWVSSQYQWSTTKAWLGQEIGPADPASARDEVVQRWLATFGPGTLNDIKWWTGWGVRDTRKALEQAGAIEIALEDGPGFVHREDLEAEQEPELWVALLPSLDPTTMGWKERDWYLGEHQSSLFDRNGNAGPSVWVNGRIVGGWGQRADGELVVELFEDVGSEAESLIGTEAERLSGWLEGVTVTPRFRTPLEKRISAS